uniref:Uncharacterized protein n=1 Tax=Anguilla anguilla TaxID=7936 RepID=A0A0E9R8N1_ANGAN
MHYMVDCFREIAKMYIHTYMHIYTYMQYMRIKACCH